MKLKYYLRGIGVGLILAVVVYSTMIIPRKYRMTDEEIKNRAGELGMVQREDPDVDLSALSITPSPEGVMTPSPDGELTPGADVTGEAQDTPGITSPAEPDKPDPPEEPGRVTPHPTPTQPPAQTITPQGVTTVPPPTQATTPQGVTMPPPTKEITPPQGGTPIADPTLPASEEGTRKVTVTVTAGMGSADFARAAYRAGLIDDVEAFDRYLMQNGYASSIMVGTYQIPKGATYGEIARIVTGQ